MAQHPNGEQPHRHWHIPENRNVGEPERYGSILGGMGLIMAGLTRRGSSGVLLGALGALLVQRGVTGQCAFYQSLGVSGAKSDRPGVPDNVGLNLSHSIVINRPREELYAFWRHLPNLARVMKHIERIDLLDERRSHWVVTTPREVENAGSVRFEPEPHGQGTIGRVKIEYNPPGGLLGRLTGRLLRDRAAVEIREDLAELKRMMESGELAQK